MPVLNSQSQLPNYIKDDFMKLSIPTGAANVTLATTGTTSLAVSYGMLYIGSAGTLVLNLADGSSGVTFSSVQIGFLPVLVTGIISAGTTAANLVVCY